jgi:hypothetical protein
LFMREYLNCLWEYGGSVCQGRRRAELRGGWHPRGVQRGPLDRQRAGPGRGKCGAWDGGRGQRREGGRHPEARTTKRPPGGSPGGLAARRETTGFRLGMALRVPASAGERRDGEEPRERGGE